MGESYMTAGIQIADSRIAWPSRHSPASSVVFAQNVIEIAASPEAVWAALIDCVKWPLWYQHCSDVSILRGGAFLNASSKFRFKTLRFYFEPEIETFLPCQTLVWSAKGPAGTSGAHAWYIEPTPGGCRVITEETQRGLLLFFMRSSARDALLVAHKEWLRALKELTEAR
jgi:hypothetical protein